MLSIVTVASSTRMPTASARPPSVMMLSVWPIAASAAIAPRIGQRDRGGDDQRGAPAAEEQQDHQTGQRRGDHALADHALNRRPHEQRLIGDRLDLQFVGQRGLDDCAPSA